MLCYRVGEVWCCAVLQCCPGWCRTEMGGAGAMKSAAQGNLWYEDGDVCVGKGEGGGVCL